MGNSEIFTKVRSKMTWPDRACFAKVAVSPKRAKRREATMREDKLVTPFHARFELPYCYLSAFLNVFHMEVHFFGVN